MRAGQVAAAAGVNLQTLRYYERRGLLAAPDRTLGGHRLYSAEAVTLLRVIKTAYRPGMGGIPMITTTDAPPWLRRSTKPSPGPAPCSHPATPS